MSSDGKSNNNDDDDDSESQAKEGVDDDSSPWGALLVAGGAYERLREFADMALARPWAAAGEDADAVRRTELVLIPTAAPDDALARRLESDKAEWFNLGFSHVHVLHTRDRAEADSDAFVAPLRSARLAAVWVSGGVQRLLHEAYVGTRTQRALLDANRGPGAVLVGGSSAGAAIMSAVMIECSDEEGAPVVTEGLALAPELVFDQHFLKRNRIGRLVEVVRRHPHLTGVGVDEGTAVFVNRRTMRVVGDSYVVVVAVDGRAEGGRLVLNTFAASDEDIGKFVL